VSNQLFLVERYDDSGIPDRQELLPALPPNVPMVFAIRIPADDVILVLVEGPDEESMVTVLAAAGWRVDRITPASWARPGDEGSR
jgi:hypothetical protein